jgi:hypothetical protein
VELHGHVLRRLNQGSHCRSKTHRHGGCALAENLVEIDAPDPDAWRDVAPNASEVDIGKTPSAVIHDTLV